MWRWLLIIVLALSLSACGTPTKTKMVVGYEGMGKAITQIHKTGVNLCEKEKIIPEEDCKKIKKIYNDTRKVYLVTGDTMILALELEGTQWSQTATDQYAKLSAEFTSLLLQWLRLTTELGLIRKE
jgi:hypothetical protein